MTQSKGEIRQKAQEGKQTIARVKISRSRGEGNAFKRDQTRVGKLQCFKVPREKEREKKTGKKETSIYYAFRKEKAFLKEFQGNFQAQGRKRKDACVRSRVREKLYYRHRRLSSADYCTKARKKKKEEKNK